MNDFPVTPKAGLAAFTLLCLFAIPTPPVFAANSGLDTPTGVGSLPFGIEGTQVMTLTATGLGVGGGGIAPTQALDVDGYVRLRAINGEGGTIELDGNNGTTMWVENLNGTFRLINSPWNAQLFSVDQSGNTNINGGVTINGANLVMTACPSWAHFVGSYVGDGCDGTLHLHSGGTLVEVDNANLTINGITTSNNEFIGTLQGGYGQFRMVGGGFGAFWRNDGSNTYLLLTNNGDAYGGWNGLRPIYVNDASGAVNFGQGIEIAGGNLTFPDGTTQTTAYQNGGHQWGGEFMDLNNRCWVPNGYTGGCNSPSGFTMQHMMDAVIGAGTEGLYTCVK